jgi:hypothetical protein
MTYVEPTNNLQWAQAAIHAFAEAQGGDPPRQRMLDDMTRVEAELAVWPRDVPSYGKLGTSCFPGKCHGCGLATDFPVAPAVALADLAQFFFSQASLPQIAAVSAVAVVAIVMMVEPEWPHADTYLGHWYVSRSRRPCARDGD